MRGAASLREAGIAVQFPIFTGGQRELDIVGAGYSIQQAMLEKETIAKSIESEVKQAWLTVQTLEALVTRGAHPGSGGRAGL
jgi:outer membrane protein TolC